jgi:hypothetical protein
MDTTLNIAAAMVPNISVTQDNREVDAQKMLVKRAL